MVQMNRKYVSGLIDTPTEYHLALDPGICYFVLIPIFLVVFMRSLLQRNMSKAVRTKPTLTQVDRITHNQAVARSKRIRQCGHWLPPSSYLRRRKYMTSKALAKVEVKKTEAGEQNIDDMSSMMSMMKGNTLSYISNIGFMIWVNSFFTGFLLVRLPFTLTETLRPLVQRDIELPSFDCSYVSSLSWYFITFFGISGLNSILLGGGNEDVDMKMMKDQMEGGGGGPMGGMMPGGGMPGMTGGYDPNAMLSQERNELKIVKHQWLCHDADDRLATKWSATQ